MAAGLIRRGWIVAFPTETVYGLGADIFNTEAVGRIFAAKRRPADNPLIAHIGSLGQLDDLASEVPGYARSLIDAFFPGPLTLVLKKTSRVPSIATAGLDTIGVRMPRHPFAQEFLQAAGTPVVAPSANLSGRPSPTTWRAVFEDLNGRIDCILQGDATEIGLESTVVDCSGERPTVLRSGSVSLADILAVVPAAVAADPRAALVPRSPGMKHKHYSPAAKVKIVDRPPAADPGPNAAFIGTTDSEQPYARKYIARDTTDYAHTVFEFFRECDRDGIELIHCEAVSEEGIGTALMDRIRRAAQG